MTSQHRGNLMTEIYEKKNDRIVPSSIIVCPYSRYISYFNDTIAFIIFYSRYKAQNILEGDQSHLIMLSILKC